MTRDELIEMMQQALHDGGYNLRKAIAAMEAAGVVMVPAEPTAEMLQAAHWERDGGGTVWRKILRASPFQKSS
jgi:hypothetical protein